MSAVSTVTGPVVAGGAMARQLLRRARLELDAAHETYDPAMRFLHAHMAAIRSASAVLALAAPGPRRRRRVLSVWEQLADAGEAWEGWAATFAAGAPVRAAVEAGRAGEVGDELAVPAVDAAERFHDAVSELLRTAGAASLQPIAS